ncbi:Optic atrophy 3-like [Trinorchestia longiramus]|nr:Optic atrophy 3-like [Trinorchestia longiramus]
MESCKGSSGMEDCNLSKLVFECRKCMADIKMKMEEEIERLKSRIVFLSELKRKKLKGGKSEKDGRTKWRNYICIPPAQFYNWCDVRMKMYLSNIIRTNDSVPIPKLNEQAAIELGANLLGE